MCLCAQPCLTLCSPMDCSLPGKNTGVGYHALLQGIFPTQGPNPCLLCLLHWQADSFTTSANRKAYIFWMYAPIYPGCMYDQIHHLCIFPPIPWAAFSACWWCSLMNRSFKCWCSLVYLCFSFVACPFSSLYRKSNPIKWSFHLCFLLGVLKF